MTAPPPTIVVPGNHDGVHLGHRALLAAAQKAAVPRGARVVALTFDPHPLRVLAPERAPMPMTTVPRRTALLRALGADDVVVLRFDEGMAASSPEAWIEGTLRAELGTVGVVVGPDYRFGRRRAGDTALLRAHGLEVHEIPPVDRLGTRVSSTRIREALTLGDVELASELLGRVHDVEATVIEGDRRGRTLSFPTANLAPPPVLVPANGVYAVVARVMNAPEGALPHRHSPVLRGVANLGVRPTFGAGASIEVHLLDFTGDLYGKTLRVGFVARLRGERKFDGVSGLVAQIAQDVTAARERLASEDARWSWL